MARPREFDIDKAIEDISEQFWADGYEATSITDLEEATGLARASLYAAFGAKQNMLHQAIDFYLAGRIETVASAVDNGGLDAVAGWFERFATVREHKPERAAMGCLMVNSMVELGSVDPEVVARGERYLVRIRRAFSSALTMAVENGDMEGPVEEKADLASMLLMGLFVSIKGGADLEEIQRLSKVAVGVVDSWRLVA